MTSKNPTRSRHCLLALLMLFATGVPALTGVLTVALVELLTSTRRLKEDAAMGLVFPALFSVGIVLITRHAGNVHLDIDAVLLGELAFAPFDRLELAGREHAVHFGDLERVAVAERGG